MMVKPLWTTRFGARQTQCTVDTLVVHTMYHPESVDCFSAKLCRDWLDFCEVSTHYIIDRAGDVWQTVLEDHLAWHAGQSQMPFPNDQRQCVNDFSLGVELLATEDSGIEPAQYESLAQLLEDVRLRHPIENVVGHSSIAPGRKTDPWGFDWHLFQQLCDAHNCSQIRFLDRIQAAPACLDESKLM